MNYRKVYCGSEWCEVSDNCARHLKNLVTDSWERLIVEDLDRDDECGSYEPIKEEE